MPQSPKISFVVWPNGEVDENSLTVSGETIARERFVSSYLPEQWFGNTSRGYVAGTLWRGAQDKGFRSYTIKINKDGVPVLDN
jgi:hypothetical protein